MIGLLFSGIGALFLYIAARYSFFELKSCRPVSTTLRFPLIGFIGYLLIFFFIAPLSIQFFGSSFMSLMVHSPPLLLMIIQLFALGWVILYLAFFSCLQKKAILGAVWIHPDHRNMSSFFKDVGLGLVTWIIAFPVVVAVSQITESIVFMLTGYVGLDQLAIRFLKLAKGSFYLLIMALFSILIAAPIIEEFVFRGILYTYLRNKMSRKRAIILSSIIFAFFHFSLDQGLSNISLLVSLFSLSLFLAFLYEKERSLIAPIALHMTFNSISVMRILIN
jgi:membrane protease YdiL (CAAX protease family)